MKRSDVVLLTLGSVGLFMAGVIWRPVFGDFEKLKDALECTSFLATTVAAVVAIFALNAWKAQFRHAERFSTLRTLKDAITDLHLYRGYLLAVIATCNHLRAHKGEPDPQLTKKEADKREHLKSALSAYKKAWAASVAFFTPEEEAKFPGPPDVFLRLFISRPTQIYKACDKYFDPEFSDDFAAVTQLYDNEAMELFKDTVEEIEMMLRRKA